MSDILDTIDNTLRDYSVSLDAMRWTPDPEKAQDAPAPKARSGVQLRPFLEVLLSITPFIEQLTEVMKRVGEAFHGPTRPAPRHRPRPLPVDGFAYRGRHRRRNRRKK